MPVPPSRGHSVVGLPSVGLLDARRVKMIGTPNRSRPRGDAEDVGDREDPQMTNEMTVVCGVDYRRLVTVSADSSRVFMRIKDRAQRLDECGPRSESDRRPGEVARWPAAPSNTPKASQA